MTRRNNPAIHTPQNKANIGPESLEPSARPIAHPMGPQTPFQPESLESPDYVNRERYHRDDRPGIRSVNLSSRQLLYSDGKQGKARLDANASREFTPRTRAR